MACFEKGRGSRKRCVTLKQCGSILIKDEIDGASEMLTGYLQCGTTECAREALLREVAALHAAGLAPADSEAKSLASSISPPKSSGELPIRQDIYVYNEATGMMLTSHRMAGKALEEGSTAWNKALLKGDIFPITLRQDDPFVIRIVVGGDLEQAESDEWVARTDWHLSVKDGKLCITGGSILVNEEYDADDSYVDQFVRTVTIPKGHYRISLYSYATGINGPAALDSMGIAFDAFEGEEHVDFLAHLTPVETAPKDGLAIPPADGWFGEALNARKPPVPIQGLKVRDLIGRVNESAKTWLFAFDAFKECETCAATTVAGGPVAVPVDEVAAVPQLAWFCSRLVVHGMRAVMPEAASITAPLPDGIVAVADAHAIRFAFSSDLYPIQLLQAIGEMGSYLRQLPDGTVLESCASQQAQLPSTNPLAGRHRFRGELRNGTWWIDSAYPSVAAATLESALKLAKEIQYGDTISFRSPEEGTEIKRWAESTFTYALEDNPALLTPTSLSLSNREPNVLALYGAAAFAVRFSDNWPVVIITDNEW